MLLANVGCRPCSDAVFLRVILQGKLDYYKLVEGVWTFGVSDMEMQLANADKYKWYTLSGLKIVAMDGSESKRRRR